MLALILRLTIIASVLVGHFGWWVFVYNRVNATGLPRKLIKFFEKAICIPLTLLLPVLLVGIYFGPITQWLLDGEAIPTSAAPLLYYSLFCLAVVLAIGPLWLLSRLYLLPPKQLSQTAKIAVVNLQNQWQEICHHPTTRTLARLPGNEILKLELNRKTLLLPQWPQYLDGFRIGHISDLHFTGQLAPAFYRQAFSELLAQRPDVIALTGDIIDKAHCLPWIAELLGELTAPHGLFFVLGNHDKRIDDPDLVRQLMTKAGWQDLGGRTSFVDLHGHPIWLAGHEVPWFGKAPNFTELNNQGLPPESQLAPRVFRLALSHSPDAIDWAKSENVDLLLAGHTHGGQIRPLGIGPIVAPSWYGSQFASGVFYREPTLMHVSRGMAGVHPLRFRCAPEITILELYHRG